jgi:Ca2+:H+ antiporter
MSDAGESSRMASYNGTVLSCEQSPHARQFPSYPYHITRGVLYSSYMNVLLVFVPLGMASRVFGAPEVVVFVLNWLAIIPLASLIAFSTRELSGSVGLILGRLLKATLSNIFEMIVRNPCLRPVVYFAFSA